MNKLFLSSLCAVALASPASAFVLDLSSLIGSTLGSGVVSNSYGTFVVTVSPGTSVVGADERIALSSGDSLTIAYPNTVTYDFSAIGGNATITDSGISVTVTANGDAQIIQTNFNAAAAVPEPSSTALIGLGGLALVLRRRK